jgi:antitoxin StbD
MVMNKPFKPEPIVPILADVGVSISDLKRNPAAVIAAARKRQVAILNRNKPVAYVISPEVWEAVLEMHEDIQDAELASERLATETPIPVTLDELLD